VQQWQNDRAIMNGRFKIEAVLGGGGFGVAYKAREFDKAGNFQRQVVIKTLNQKQQGREDFEQQQVKFVNEAMTLKGLRHPHIVRVYEMIQEDGLWGMVMEFVDGQELAEYIEEKGALSEAEALGYIKQVGEALGYLHEDGLLHRDIKPHNIILRNISREAVLIDFGLARDFVDSKTMTNAHTPGYAPIEQYDRHGKFGPHTDIYALAATLYHLLTGEPPFLPAKGRWEAQQQGQSIDILLWNKIPETVSQRTKETIVKGMAVLPEDRSTSIAEFLDLLGVGEAKQSPVIPDSIDRPNQKILTFESGSVEIINGQVKIAKRSRQAEYITLDLGNGVTLDMMSIPAGSFMMGSPPGEGFDSEKPQHRVDLPDFYMARYPITQTQYLAVMGKNPSLFKGDRRPVEMVSWLDAMEFCQRLSQLTGREFTLPSESQWEYACRANVKKPFSFGDIITTDVVNYDGNFTYGNSYKGVYRQQTTDVGTFPANDFGLHDMHGNVLEWCMDNFHNSYKGAPNDGSPWLGKILSKIVRGGSWDDLPSGCRVAGRNSYSRDYRDVRVGFRVVVSAQSPVIPDSSDRQNQQILTFESGSAKIVAGQVKIAKRSRQAEYITLDQTNQKILTFESGSVEIINGQVKIAKRSRQAEYITLDLGNGVTLDMVSIPAGSFMMGQTESERRRLIKKRGEAEYQEWFARELPQHQVNIPPFYMARYPITQAQYLAVMGENPSKFKGDRRPVENVSWDDAMEFCRKLSEITGRECILPSESQWEYACRANVKKPFSFGEIITSDVVNYNGNYTYGSIPKGVYREQTTDVGTFPANDFGLHDMHGEVWEWCLDDWHDSYKGAPNDGSPWLEKNSRTGTSVLFKILRGGAWYYNPNLCRSASRNFNSQGDRYTDIGFRVVVVSRT
jgi:formylglycine-generating enzyme required for sulfatase activity/tRNA A-37 threonylcarbamoyl transferase component Bud32